MTPAYLRMLARLLREQASVAGAVQRTLNRHASDLVLEATRLEQGQLPLDPELEGNT